jgi:hypothetical protein
MEPERSLSPLQVPITGHYPEPDKSKFTTSKEGRRVDSYENYLRKQDNRPRRRRKNNVKYI